MYFSSKAVVFVSSTVQNWTELFMIIPHLLGPSPFEVIMVIFTISQHIPHLKRIIWNDHLNIKFEQWTSFGKNVEVEVFKNKTPGSWVHWPFIYCALQCPGRGIFSSRKEMSQYEMHDIHLIYCRFQNQDSTFLQGRGWRRLAIKVVGNSGARSCTKLNEWTAFSLIGCT